MERTDIPLNDVFISWTGKDRGMKDTIVAYLQKNNISCTESDYSCAGDFAVWSREAVSKCTVFLLLYTKDTPSSEYVPLEIRAFKDEDDWHNRCVPVVTDFDLYAKNHPDIAKRESAVILNKDGLTEEKLQAIVSSVRALIRNRQFAIYRKATAPTHLRLVSLLREVRVTEELDHAKLYINRSVSDKDGRTISDAAAFCETQEIIYLYGPAGSGKTCYIDQLRNAADCDTLVMVLPCRKLTHANNLFQEMYEEFRRYCSARDYFSRENFQSLLSAKRLLLVLDGLDEIGTREGKEALFRATRDYYKANAAYTTLFITSRNPEDADMWKMNGQTPRLMKLHALEEDQIKDFGTKLFLLLGAAEKSNEFYVRTRGLADEIRTSPLLLSQLAIIYNAKNVIPQTVVGIYDAVCEIVVGKAAPSESTAVGFDKALFNDLSGILKAFSAERYRLLSLGKEKSTEQLFKKILRDKSCNPNTAAELIRYLQDRAILVGDEFYHKMLPEYFTAVYHYEQCFDDYDDLKNPDALKTLFDNYTRPYWSDVLQMFLIKADSCVDAPTAKALYRALMDFGITDFTLLFDTCRKLLRHREVAQETLLSVILERSATGVYPHYGPLFWYVPEYDLYRPLLSALASRQNSPCFTKALALCRDVCWIFGKYHTAQSVNDRIDGAKLMAGASLSGVRKGLCELFYLGWTDCTEGADIYPRCFNLAEALAWKDTGCGIFGIVGTAFDDELGLFSHEMLPEFGGEWVGIVSMEYDVARIEETLPSLSCQKLRGLILSPTESTKPQELGINSSHIRIFYPPENIVNEQPEGGSLEWFVGHYGALNYRFGFRSVGEHLFADINGLQYFRDTLALPSGVSRIESRAFFNCVALTSITIPEGVTTIGEEAFSGCTSLASITLPDRLIEIGHSAFSDCRALAFITLPDSLSEIGYNAFSDCSSLTSITIPEGVTEIGWQVFYRCSALTRVVLPKTIKRVEGNAFLGCTSLTRVINCPTGYDSTDLDVPDNCVIEYQQVCDITFQSQTEILPGEFFRRRDVKNLAIPAGVTKIGENAFSCCSSLASITIPEGVTEIGWGAFSGCSALASITLPQSITDIGSHAFSDCSSLTSITIPEGITEIGWGAFSGCTSLASITLPDRLIEIGHSAFSDCRALAFITLPDSLSEIGYNAFSDCSSLTSITVPEGVTEIGREAFSGCSSLAVVILAKTIKTVEHNAFLGCTSLLRIVNCPAGYAPADLGVADTCVIEYQKARDITFQSQTEILPREFFGRRDIKELAIPAGVTKIGERAFSGCSSLASITIPEGVTEIGSGAFSGCSSLTAITIPESIMEIGYSAFSGCSSLTSITIPEGVTEIGGSEFSGCSSLTAITIPKGVTELVSYAFSHCCSLTSISIPEGVTEIGKQAFSHCRSLASVVIPRSVRFIRDAAFAGCTGLRMLTLSRRFEDDLARIFPDVDLTQIEIIWQ